MILSKYLALLYFGLFVNVLHLSSILFQDHLGRLIMPVFETLLPLTALLFTVSLIWAITKKVMTVLTQYDTFVLFVNTLLTTVIALFYLSNLA
ncbi:MAG: hypothetical protein WAX38_04435 [Minisyncoccia bacterium]